MKNNNITYQRKCGAAAAVVMGIFGLLYLTQTVVEDKVVDNRGSEYSAMVKNQPSIVEVRETAPINYDDLEQGDPRLIELIRSKYLDRPPAEPFLMKDGTKRKAGDRDISQFGQVYWLTKLLGKKRNGFFIECGAFDGLTGSNTFYLEQVLGWEGVLIEAGRTNYQKLLSAKRNAWSINACLSRTNRSSETTFNELGVVGSLNKLPEVLSWPASPNTRGYMKTDSAVALTIRCFPVYSILKALGRTEVDFFSLDVEGVELEVLSAIPWELVTIKVLTIEFNNIPEGEDALIELMASKGYKCYKRLMEHDMMFYDPSYFTSDEQEVFLEMAKELQYCKQDLTLDIIGARNNLSWV